MEILEDFEAYEGSGDFEATPTRYEGLTGDGWLIGTNGGPTTRPFIREYDAPTNFVVPKPPGVGGNKHLFFGPVQNGLSLSANYAFGGGFGVWAYSTHPSTGSAQHDPVSIQWAGSSAAGGIEVAQQGSSIRVLQWFDDGTYVETVSTYDAPITVPDPEESIWGWTWLDISFSRADGWTIRDPFTGVVAAGAYSWSVPSAAEWLLSCQFTNGSSMALDNIYAWAGSMATAVRLYPRDDALGMSSAPRHWPSPKSQRIIGRIP